MKGVLEIADFDARAKPKGLPHLLPRIPAGANGEVSALLSVARSAEALPRAGTLGRESTR